MKTTLEIADPLLKAAKAQARREGTTLRALIERSLRTELNERRSKKPFVLRDASVRGQGMQPVAARMSWDEIRDLSYRNSAD